MNTVLLLLNFDPDCGRWWQVISTGELAVNQVEAGRGQRLGGVENLGIFRQGAQEVVMAIAEVGDAVPTIGTRKMEDVFITSLMPGQLLWCNQFSAKGKCAAEN